MMRVVLLLFLTTKLAMAEPKWFLEPDPQDGHIYGTGSSTNKQEAENLALQNATSKIRTTVSGTTRDEIARNSRDGKVSTATETRNIALNQAEKIKISGFEVTNSAKEGKVFYTRIRVSKNRIFNENSAVFEELLARFEELAEGAHKSKGTVQAAQNASKMLKIAPELKNQAEILYALNSSFDYSGTIRHINKLNSAAESLLSGISIKVEGSNKEVVSAAKNGITASGFKTSSIMADLTMKIEIESPQMAEVYGSKYCKNIANLTIFEDEKEVASNTFQIKGIGASEAEACRGSMRDLGGQIGIITEKLLMP